ncbi:hypothetical protein ACEWY4_004487 [Coilia grayii]|uniref:Laminin EGF-like domain-containing protein n=1 Tax=Coilia grayii TaxID=363190 RepID=A0ABD1KLR8_9TELE
MVTEEMQGMSPLVPNYCVSPGHEQQRGTSELRCNCSAEGTLDPNDCHPETGRCACLEGYAGLLCDVCEDGYFTNGSTGCLPCGCDSFGAVGSRCDSRVGSGKSSRVCQGALVKSFATTPACKPIPPQRCKALSCSAVTTGEENASYDLAVEAEWKGKLVPCKHSWLGHRARECLLKPEKWLETRFSGLHYYNTPRSRTSSSQLTAALEKERGKERGRPDPWPGFTLRQNGWSLSK